MKNVNVFNLMKKHSGKKHAYVHKPNNCMTSLAPNGICQMSLKRTQVWSWTRPSTTFYM